MNKKAILKIRVLGDECLRARSSEVDTVGVSERMLIRSMIETMYAAQGIGLAAPQIGINKRIIVVDVGDGPVALVNPVVNKERGKAVMEEGCLSVPNGCVKVERPESISVHFLDHESRPRDMECSGLLARAIQHEIDHLNGILIVDYADLKEQKKIKEHYPDIQF